MAVFLYLHLIALLSDLSHARLATVERATVLTDAELRPPSDFVTVKVVSQSAGASRIVGWIESQALQSISDGIALSVTRVAIAFEASDATAVQRTGSAREDPGGGEGGRGRVVRDVTLPNGFTAPLLSATPT